MFPIDTIGFTAAVIMTSAYLPQVIKTWKCGGNSLSYFMLVLQIIGASLWLTYGSILGKMPIVLANAVSLTLVITIFAIKVKQQRGGQIE